MKPVDWKVLKEETTKLGRFEIVFETVQFTPDTVGPYSYVKFAHNGVCILPIIDNNWTLFVRQYRRAVDSIHLEIPAGMIDVGESPAEAAARELREETGIVADNLIDCGYIFASPGSTTEIMYLFIAFCSSGKQLKQSLDSSENIELVQMSIADARKQMLDGTFHHGASQILLCRYLLEI